MTDCYEQLREALEQDETVIEKAVAILREQGFVFRRFPRDMEKEPPANEEERWEALAFELYTQIAVISEHARAALSAEGECLHRAEAERFRVGIREVFEISDSFGPRQELPRWAKDDLQAILDGKPVGAGIRARLAEAAKESTKQETGP